MKLYIKNMVCNRCKMVVKAEIEKAGLQPASVELGEVELPGVPENQQLQELDTSLRNLVFEIIDNRKARMIEQVKNLIITLIHHSDQQISVNLSDYISKKLGYEYNYLSNLFSDVEGTTIEKYLIAQKIQKVKELLMQDELTLSQIAARLSYSSVRYLSNQFKKQTGLTTSFYKSGTQDSRKSLDNL